MLINQKNEKDLYHPEYPLDCYVSVYDRNRCMRLSMGTFRLLEKPSGVELYWQKETKRLFITPSTSADAYPLKGDENKYRYYFSAPVIIRWLLKYSKKVPVCPEPEIIDGRPMYQIEYKPKPAPAPESDDLPDSTTLAAALELAEWIVRNRPTSFLAQAKIDPASRKRLLAHYSK